MRWSFQTSREIQLARIANARKEGMIKSQTAHKLCMESSSNIQHISRYCMICLDIDGERMAPNGTPHYTNDPGQRFHLERSFILSVPHFFY